MLGRLIKYELKTSYKLMLFVHAFILILSLIMGAFLWFQSNGISNDYVSTFAFGIVAFVIALLYGVLVIASLFGTQVFIAVRFYKNLFTDEGYLMHTLPVTPTQLIHSKIITGILWTAFNGIIVLISVLVLFSPYLTTMLGFTDISDTVFAQITFANIPVLCYGIVAYIYSLLMIYACICLGQLFNKNRLLASVIIYCALNLVVQIIQSGVLLAGNTAINMATNYLYTASATQALAALDLELTILTMHIIPGIIFYLICQIIMHKKINLL